MDIFTLLQIIIALTFIYFIVSLVVSEVQEQIVAWHQLRAKNLKKAIEIFIGKTLCEELYKIYEIDDNQSKIGPSYLEAEIFAQSLVRLIYDKLEDVDELSPNLGLFFVSADGADKNIVDKINSIKGNGDGQIEEKITNRLIEIAYLTKLKHDNPTIADFTNEIANTFNEVMERTSGVYKRNAKGLSILFGIVSAAAFNIDTLYIVNQLYKDPGLRENFEQAATNLVNTYEKCRNEANGNQEEINKCQKDLDNWKTSFEKDQSLPIGWNEDTKFWNEWDENTTLVKKSLRLLKSVIGWLISAIAIAMGAPFWFDLLSKVVNVRNTLRPLLPSSPKIKLPQITQPATTNTLEETPTVRAAMIEKPTPTNITQPPPTPSTMKEIRGVWLLSHYNSDVLKSRDNIKRALEFLDESGFNTLFVAVWNRGYTAFESGVMASDEYDFTKQDPEYEKLEIDPLREVIDINDKNGHNFDIFPWFEYGFAASPSPDGGHILKAKKEWSALDQSGKKVRHGGLTWMNSLDKDVQEFMTKLIVEVIEKYGEDITGIQGCDRLPAMPHLGGYDQGIKDDFKKAFNYEPSNTKDPKWVQFRADMLTDYLKRLRNAIKTKDSNCVFSIAPSPFPFGLNEVLQDSDDWVKRGLVDFICPQFYRPNFSSYKREVDLLTQRFSKDQLKKYVPGIAFMANNRQLSPRDIIDAVKHNRQRGLGGQVFFFYEGLLEDNKAIATALKSRANFSQVAEVPKFPLV